MWQDWLLAVINWGFVVALIPTILHKTHKPSLWSCILTSFFLTAISFTYTTLELWYAAIGAGATAITWYILLYQRWQLNKREEVVS